MSHHDVLKEGFNNKFHRHLLLNFAQWPLTNDWHFVIASCVVPVTVLVQFCTSTIAFPRLPIGVSHTGVFNPSPISIYKLQAKPRIPSNCIIIDEVFFIKRRDCKHCLVQLVVAECLKKQQSYDVENKGSLN